MHSTTRTGPLRPAELAEAVVLADLSLALTVVGQVVPFGGALLVAAVVPLAVVGSRHRLRAVVAGAIAAGMVGFLVIGTAALTTMSGCAAFGALVGAADRRGWGRRRTMVIGVIVLWPPIALLVDFLLWAFSDLRELTLDNIRNAWRGLFRLLDNIGLSGVAEAGDRAVSWMVRNWWMSVPILLFFLVIVGIWLTHGLSAVTLRRVRAAFGPPETARDDAEVAEPADEGPAPLPVALHDVEFRYPNAQTDALAGVSLCVEPGEMVAIVGRNGSGKSTLARILAGRHEPTGGRVERPGAIGLGAPGGTAFVFQRPEAQVLGVRVRDDVVWGLADPASVDVDGALARVGLSRLATRETSTLSGGELQRLAVAAALARAPQLLVSDESTAMVDVEGRARLVTLLRDLAREGVGVVHVSHAAIEADAADRTIVLDAGRVIAEPRQRDQQSACPPARGAVTRAHTWASGRALIELHGVGHVYSRGTPWANRALEGVDLAINQGESLLVVGHNGSGKSTLAWILAGLVVPSEGEALIKGTDNALPRTAQRGSHAADEQIAAHIGRVGLAFQHARLQLLRPVVVDEVSVAAGVSTWTARGALADVGLAGELADRRIDELSGGQMRRVVLASVLAARPRALVLDEPFAGLDAEGRADLEGLLVRLRNEHDIALMIVSHDYDLHGDLIERVVELEDGRIVRDEGAVEWTDRTESGHS